MSALTHSTFPSLYSGIDLAIAITLKSFFQISTTYLPIPRLAPTITALFILSWIELYIAVVYIYIFY